MKAPSKRKRDAERAAERKERKLAEKARARRAEIESTTAEGKAVRGRGEDGSEYDKQLAYLYGGEYEVGTRDESGEERVETRWTDDSLRGDRRRIYEVVRRLRVGPTSDAGHLGASASSRLGPPA